MIRLSATTEKLRAVLGGATTTNQLHCTVCFSDHSGAGYPGDVKLTATNDTTPVDICAAPASGIIRDIDYILIHNRDTAAATVTVSVYDATTDWVQASVELAVGDKLEWTHGSGWKVLTAAGEIKTSGSGSSGIADGDTLTVGLTFPNTGLHLLDTNASHDLILSAGSDLTADRTLTLTTGDAARTLTLSANLTVESTSLVNQDLTSDATPTFAGAALQSGTTTVGTLAGTIDAGGATSFEIPNSAAPTVNADGEIALDTTVTDWSHGIIRYYGGEELFLVAMPVAQLTTPSDGYVVAYNATADEFQLSAAGAGDVSAAATFGTDNVLIRADGTSKGVQSSGITCDDSNNLTGVASITVGNTGLHIFDTLAGYDLILKPGSALTADKTLTITTGDADRTFTLSGNLTVESASLVNQDLTSDATPTFAGAALSTGTTTVGTLAGTIDAGGATSLEIPNGTGVLVNAAGEVAIDTDADNVNITQGLLIHYDGTRVMYNVAVDALPTNDGYVLTYDGTGKKFGFEAAAAGGDVTAASTFGTDNVLIRSDGTSKGVQSSVITCADTTGALTGPAGGWTLTGGTGSGDNLTLESTTHATKGWIELSSIARLKLQGSAPGTPASGYGYLWAEATSPDSVWFKNDGGTAYLLNQISIYIRDEQTSGTNGGTFTSGAWRTRTLNTEVSDPASWCSLASNQFTLTAGTYHIIARAPAFGCNGHQSKLYNATGAADIILGSNAFGSTTVQSDSWVIGVFTVAASQALEIQHQCATTKSNNGFGSQNSFGTEVYTEVWLRRVS